MQRDISDLKATQLALQQSEARYRAIVEDQTELISRFLPDTTILFVNDAYCRYFGMHREDLIGRSYSPIVYEADREKVSQLVQSMSIHNPTVLVENRVVVNGDVRWTQWANRTLFDEQGNITEIQSVGRDISELKQIEEALRQSESRFRQLAETVQEGFFVFETESSCYSYLNPACEAMIGTPIPALAQEKPFTRGMSHWLDKIHPGDRDRIEASLCQERLGKNFDEEYRFICPNGEIRWLRSQAFPICNEHGEVVRIVGIVKDITARKLAEAALRASEEYFRRAFDDAPIGVSLVAPTGQFLKVNTYYSNLLGYTQAELLTLKFQQLTHPADLKQEMEGLHQMLAGDIRSFQIQKRYITKQGTVVPVLMHAALIRDHNEQPLYFVGHIQDIRDRLEVERMKDQFISIISHELRTPLASIRGALDLLASGVYDGRPEKANRMLNIAINNSDRLVHLVDDILDLERLSSGEVQLVKQQCQAADLMQQAVDSVQEIADQFGITLCVTPVDTTLSAAPDSIIQALTNLLSNAIKFSSPGSTIWLQAELQVGKRESVSAPSLPLPFIHFSAKDQGRGIPADKLESIFEQFQQVDVSDSRRKGGTGLGLAICKKIVQQHGGRIWVESTLGEGSTFHFTLPLSETGEHD